MRSLNQKLEVFIRNFSEFDFPGLKIQVHLEGEKVADLAFGETYKYYDLASLTKIIFTTTYFMQQVSDGQIALKQKASSYLPWYSHSSSMVGELLNHSAGNDWWQPFFKDIDLDLEPQQRFQQMEEKCRQAPLRKGAKAVYSDLDFYLLGSIMQSVEHAPMLNVWQKLKSKHFAQTQLHFNSENKPKYQRRLYAPTEKCSWRKKLIQGEVHDENAWALGGVAPHAGLFGRVDDLATYGLYLRSLYRGGGEMKIAKTVMRKFAKRSMPQRMGDWGYGFMLPSGKGSSAGDQMSPLSFGHTGFTGISLWYDPTRDLLVSLVSNRVHPSRKNRGFISLRPQLHNLIVESIEELK